MEDADEEAAEAKARLWAALASGGTRSILSAIRRARPATLAAVHDFLAAVERGDIATDHSLPSRMHELLDAETEAMACDASQRQLLRHCAAAAQRPRRPRVL